MKVTVSPKLSEGAAGINCHSCNAMFICVGAWSCTEPGIMSWVLEIKNVNIERMVYAAAPPTDL